jgi:hypothetical protein
MSNSYSITYGFIEYLTAFFIILQCNSVFSNVHYNFINMFSILFMFILFIASLIRLSSDKLPRNNLLILIISFIFLTLIYLIIEYFFIGNFDLITILSFFISPIVFMTYFYEKFVSRSIKTSIISKFVNIMIFLSIISLFYWILALLGHPGNTGIFIDWGGKRVVEGYNYLFFVTQHTNIGSISIIRNTGIFVETPMYSYVLSIAFLFQMFILKLNKKSDFIKIGILFITIITTTSTTGIIVSLLSIIYYIFFTGRIKNYLKIIITPVGFLLMYIANVVFSSKQSSDLSSSYAIRMNDIHSCIQAWISHPLLGVGMNNNVDIQQYMYPFRLTFYGRSFGNEGLSTGIGVILAYGGLIFFLWYIMPIAYSMFKDKNRFIISLMMIVLLLYTNVPFGYVNGIFLGYFWLSFLYSKNDNRFLIDD